MAKLNNNNVSVNFGFAGNCQTGTAAVVVRSRQGKMRSHTGKPLSQPHFLRDLDPTSRGCLEQTEEAEALCLASSGPASPATPSRAWAELIPPAAVYPAIWASLVISRATTL